MPTGRLSVQGTMPLCPAVVMLTVTLALSLANETALSATATWAKPSPGPIEVESAADHPFSSIWVAAVAFVFNADVVAGLFWAAFADFREMDFLALLMFAAFLAHFFLAMNPPDWTSTGSPY